MARVSAVCMLAALTRVQSSLVRLTISMMVGTPRPSSPTSHAVAPSYSISLGRVGVIAELVLQPLQEHPVAAAVGQHSRQQEAGQTAWGLGQHPEDVAHRCRGEPLVP